MRNSILALSISLSPLLAQAQQQQTLFLKPVIGINRFNVHANGFDSKKQFVGLNVGLGGEYKISKHLSVDAALMYFTFKNEIHRDYQKGGIGQFPVPITIEFNETSHYHFVRLPIDILYKQDKPSPFYFGVGLGAIYNINVRRDLIGLYPDTHSEQNEGSAQLSMENELSGKLGAFGTAIVGKEWKIRSIVVGGRIEYSMDITRWKYTTNYFERQEPYLMTTSGFSLNIYTLL